MHFFAVVVFPPPKKKEEEKREKRAIACPAHLKALPTSGHEWVHAYACCAL